MKLAQLRAVIALYHHRSFGKAAAAEGVDKSALSRRIAELEREVGFVIFVRRRTQHGTTATMQGQALIAKASEIISSIKAIEALRT
jgi:DNA-binding transcriptional LysR family regulator